jgi:hypothetical protein
MHPEEGVSMTIDPSKLGDAAVFEGKAVAEVAVEIPNVAGGLNRAMPVDPVVVTQGDEFYIVAKVEAAKIRHEPIEKDEPGGMQRRVQIAPAVMVGVATGKLVDDVAAFLDAQQRRIDEHEADVEAATAAAKRAAKDAAAGQTTVSDFVGDELITADDAKPKNVPGEPGNTAAGKGDEVAAKRAEKVKKSTTATKSNGRQVTPIPKKTHGRKRAPAKKASGALKRTH